MSTTVELQADIKSVIRTTHGKAISVGIDGENLTIELTERCHRHIPIGFVEWLIERLHAAHDVERLNAKDSLYITISRRKLISAMDELFSQIIGRRGIKSQRLLYVTDAFNRRRRRIEELGNLYNPSTGHCCPSCASAEYRELTDRDRRASPWLRILLLKRNGPDDVQLARRIRAW
jgi:hypothetical protein